MIINENAIINCLKKKKDTVKAKYLYIINTNNLIDETYKKNYISYYKMYRSKGIKNTNYYEIYFDYLNRNRTNKKLDFKETMIYLNNNCFGNDGLKKEFISPSFASKMLATIDPNNRVVWDKNVLVQLESSSFGGNSNYKEIYKLYRKKDINKYIDELDKMYKELDIILKKRVTSKEGKLLIKIFDKVFFEDEYKVISNLKKLDIVYWSLGKDKIDILYN